MEEFGLCQNAYTATFYTTTGNAAVNVDGNVLSTGTVYDDELIWTQIAENQSRGLLGFDISSIQGKTVLSATLRVYLAYNFGGSYNVIVDHINFGNSMTEDDYSLNTLSANIGTISNNDTLEWKELDVTSYVQSDLAAPRTSSQYRFILDTVDANTKAFEDAENAQGTGNRPELVVTYE